MPTKPATVCRSRDCRRSTTNNNGYCDECEAPVSQTRRGKKGDPFYWSTAWKKLRDMKKHKDPLCEDCLAAGRLMSVDVVDHVVEIKYGGRPLDMDNLKSLCHRCHAKKTKAEQRKREGAFESPPTPPAQPFSKKTCIGFNPVEKS